MQPNKVYHSSFLENTLPDKSVNLLIADPPYFEVKGGFDFIWSSMEEYLKDVEIWAKECKRLLADNGTLFWWGHAKKIAYSQIIFDKYFKLENSLVWENINTHKQQIRYSDGLRSFAPLTERLLMYSNGCNATGLELIKEEHWSEMSPFSKIIKEHLNKGFTQKQISLLQLSKKGKPTGWVSNKIKFGELPTPVQWELICNLFKIKNKYETLRQEYEDLRRPFNNIANYGDVIRVPNYETKDFAHPTIKPEKLTRALILTCSRPNDLVFVPFAGSGTECAMAAKEGRNFVGFDIEKKYVDMANKRAAIHLNQTKLY